MRLYNLTMDPYEKYDMTFNGAMSYRLASSSPGKYAGQDNGWVLSLIYPPLIEFDKSIIKYPNIRRFPGGASNDLRPNLQDPSNPVPAMDPNKPPRIGGGAVKSQRKEGACSSARSPLRRCKGLHGVGNVHAAMSAPGHDRACCATLRFSYVWWSRGSVGTQT